MGFNAVVKNQTLTSRDQKFGTSKEWLSNDYQVF
jgi:hypothetical protein